MYPSLLIAGLMLLAANPASTTRIAWQTSKSDSPLDKVPRSEARARLAKLLLNEPERLNFLMANGNPNADSAEVAKAAKHYDYSELPVLLSSDESMESTTWLDWNRVNGSVFFVRHGGSTGIRSFITLQVFSNRTSYLTYEPNKDEQYDFTAPPTPRVLTREQKVRHWANLPKLGFGPFERDRMVFYMGFSPKAFKLGESSTAAVEADKVAYLLGAGYLFNPFVGVTLGWVTEDGRSYLPGGGVSLDIDIITKLFK